MAESAARGRARRLAVGGLAGGGVAGIVALLAHWLFAGASALPTVAVAWVVTLLFFALGQLVQVLLADADPLQVTIAALGSYVIRVFGLGVVLMVVLSHPDRAAWLAPIPLVVTTIAVVIGWLAGEFTAYSRLRIPVFDSTDTPER